MKVAQVSQTADETPYLNVYGVRQVRETPVMTTIVCPCPVLFNIGICDADKVLFKFFR